MASTSDIPFASKTESIKVRGLALTYVIKLSQNGSLDLRYLPGRKKATQTASKALG